MKIKRTVKVHAQAFIIWVGGAGCSVIKNLKALVSDLDVKLLALDSSEQSLKGLSKKESYYTFSQKFLRGDGVFGRWDIAQELFQKEKNEILLPSNKEEQRVFYNVATSLAQLMESADAIFFIYPD